MVNQVAEPSNHVIPGGKSTVLRKLMFLILCASFPISVTAQQYTIENMVRDIADRCYKIIDALSAAGELERQEEHEFRIAITEGEKENNLVGLRYAVRDLEEWAIQDLSPAQRAELEDRLNGESLADAMDAEAKAVRPILQRGEIWNDDEWHLSWRWLGHEESAHEIEFEDRSHGEIVEMLETLMLQYVQDHGDPDGRDTAERAGK